MRSRFCGMKTRSHFAFFGIPENLSTVATVHVWRCFQRLQPIFWGKFSVDAVDGFLTYT
ncbi:hypothetical protein [Nostoc piscinale]|uniref:hypothetical protein n=1 Tax=Nostoc piscinale TaxID=224012 RepID=UPI0039A59671